MKSVKIVALLLSVMALTACMGAKESPEEMEQKLTQAAQIGQAQAIAQIIDRAMTEPCQPVNLFNNIDEENKKEVNLINIACENLDLPELTTPAEAAEETSSE